MATASYSADALRHALRAVEVMSGATIAVHSSLMHLGRLEGVPANRSPERIVDVILEVLGPDGTLVVPASNWDYGRHGVPFDLQSTPSAKDLGVVPRHVLERPDVVRSLNPTFNLAMIGARAAWLAGGSNGHAFGYDSAWDRLYRLDATMVFLGCDLNAMSFSRYMEMRYGVPYLYNKLFDTPVIDRGKPIEVPIVSLLRYPEMPVEHNLARFEQELRTRGVLREVVLGGGWIRSVRTQACFEIGMECLKRDIHFFLTAAPCYPSGSPPRR
jgi:aminoglycoside 3-N-acetyltransferase